MGYLVRITTLSVVIDLQGVLGIPDSEAPVMEYPFIAITPRSTLTGVVVPVRVSSMSQLDLFKNYSYSIGPCTTPQPTKKNKKTNKPHNKTPFKQLHKKFRYELIMNEIP